MNKSFIMVPEFSQEKQEAEYSQYLQKLQKLQKPEISKLPKLPKLKVVTVATKEDGYLRVLKRELDDAGIGYKILGYGQKWEGWVWRTNLILNYLKTLNPNDIVMVIDGYDILMVGSEQDIMKKYLDFKADIVFGVHLSKSQYISPIVKYLAHPVVKAYFHTTDEHMKNGGSFMGSVKSLIMLYERILKYSLDTGTRDDQLSLNNISLEGLDYKIDVYSKIFWMWDIDSVYELLYAMINKQQSSYLNPSIKNVNRRPVFSNGIKPEIIHGIGHRDMSIFVDPELGFNHVSRVYAQDDMDMIINGARCTVFILVILVIFLLYWFFYYRERDTTKTVNY